MSGGARSQDGTGAEIEDTVEQAIANLDRNSDATITLADLKSWFDRLGSLLTVKETAEWVVHAVQLPPDVGQAFIDSAVTGFDFPDLIKDDGAALVHEVGITRRSFRKRIIKALEMRLLGLGSEPRAPAAEAVALSTSSVRVTWIQPPKQQQQQQQEETQQRRRRRRQPGAFSHLEPFPVHKCIIKRQEWSGGPAGADDGVEVEVQDAPVVVYEGLLQSFSDTGLSPGATYVYTVQLWNVIGHSEAAEVQVTLPPPVSLRASQPRSLASLVWGTPTIAPRLVTDDENVAEEEPGTSVSWVRSALGWLWHAVLWLLGALQVLLVLLTIIGNAVRLQAVYRQSLRGSATTAALQPAAARSSTAWQYARHALAWATGCAYLYPPTSTLMKATSSGSNGNAGKAPPQQQQHRQQHADASVAVRDLVQEQLWLAASGLQGRQHLLSQSGTAQLQRHDSTPLPRRSGFPSLHGFHNASQHNKAAPLRHRKPPLHAASGSSSGGGGSAHAAASRHVGRSCAASSIFPQALPHEWRSGGSQHGHLLALHAATSDGQRHAAVFEPQVDKTAQREGDGDWPRADASGAVETAQTASREKRRCGWCDRKFGLRLRRHTCCCCGADFCHKHGRTAHANVRACPAANGSCTCQACVDLAAGGAMVSTATCAAGAASQSLDSSAAHHAAPHLQHVSTGSSDAQRDQELQQRTRIDEPG
eukprot:TRINITY_DN73_c1_g1_i2.p1 TRINITY_DN73_c1_g1~~TRINITY_DN73_c1_g1_i2.p1  ORF type:complete len:704 (-),score=230.04 TRINITY_DN73_c1_g1_i2:456-2567(-)